MSSQQGRRATNAADARLQVRQIPGDPHPGACEYHKITGEALIFNTSSSLVSIGTGSQAKCSICRCYEPMKRMQRYQNDKHSHSWSQAIATLFGNVALPLFDFVLFHWQAAYSFDAMFSLASNVSDLVLVLYFYTEIF